jgi:hypothetical protein
MAISNKSLLEDSKSGSQSFGNNNSNSQNEESSPAIPRASSETLHNVDDEAKILLPEPIAICGVALRLPGGIRNTEAFWELLSNGKDAKGPMTENRMKHDDLHTEANPLVGYFVDEDLSDFDPSFFKMTESEVQAADPQQRQLLQVTRECLEAAGEVNYRGKLIGLYVGTFGEDWLHMMAKDQQSVGTYGFCGSSDVILANRISYEFDLKGPRYVSVAPLLEIHTYTSQHGNQDCMLSFNGLSTSSLSCTSIWRLRSGNHRWNQSFDGSRTERCSFIRRCSFTRYIL